jgi:hypothetical protein
MSRHSLFVLVFLFSLSSFVLCGMDAAFTIEKATGEVFHVLDGDAPRLLKPGEKISGGRLAVMEESSAEVTFPNGTRYPIPQNTLLLLDPTCETLENACAAAGGIRDRSTLFLQPVDQQAMKAGEAFPVLVAVDASRITDVATLSLAVAAIDDIDKKNPKTLLEFSAIGKPETKPGMLGYRLFHLEVPKAPSREGEYVLFVKPVTGVGDQQIGKETTIVVTSSEP